MTEFLYHTRYGDFKDFDTIKTSTILDIIQDVSTKASEEAGFGMHTLNESSLAWLMAGINVRFLKKVDTRYPVLAQTGIEKMGGVTSNRACILSQNGEVVAQSIANWFLMDMKENRIARISKEMMAAYPNDTFSDDFFKYKKPQFPEFSGEGETVIVSNRDIDTNLHLNNVKTIEIMLDGLPFDFEYNMIDIIYKRQSHLNDNLTREVIKTDNGYFVALLGEDNDVNAQAHIRFE